MPSHTEKHPLLTYELLTRKEENKFMMKTLGNESEEWRRKGNKKR
jgi:hypothetical protein